MMRSGAPSCVFSLMLGASNMELSRGKHSAFDDVIYLCVMLLCPALNRRAFFVSKIVLYLSPNLHRS